MIWLSLTFNTKVFSTSVAPNSVLGHMLRRFPTDWVAFVVFLALNDLSWLHHHHISTRTADHIRIHFNDLHKLTLLNLLLILIRYELLALEFGYFFFASRALHWLVLRLTSHDFFSEAVDVYLMEAVCALQHVQIRIHMVVFTYELITKHTQTLLSHGLHLLVDGRRPLFLSDTQNIVHAVSFDHHSASISSIIVIRSRSE